MSENYLSNVIGLKAESKFLNYSIPVAFFDIPKKDKINNKLITIVDTIEDFYLKNKIETYQNNDGGTGTQSILTHNYLNYNILDHTEYDEIMEFKEFISNCYSYYYENFIQETPKSCYIQCWGNKVRRYDYLNKHHHNSDIKCLNPSANYFLKSPGHQTYTNYYHPLSISNSTPICIPNKEGQLTIFLSYIQHSTSPNRDPSDVRYTLGIDSFTDGDDPTGCLVKII